MEVYGLETTQFDIEIRPIDSIRPYEHNPRQNDGAVDAVAASLREFGFRQPVVVDADGVIVAGHTRYKAARKLGLTKVPVHVATDLTPDQIRAYRIADNKSGELATWDFEILPIELAALQDSGFDMSVLAFDDTELAKLLDSDLQQGLTDPDDVPEPPEEPICRPGDLWSLDQHRLLCGDATDGGNMARLMGDLQADLLLTDPPYNVSYVGKTRDALTIENDAMEDAQFRSFLVSAFENADAAMRPGAVFYVWHADSEGYNFRGACRDVGWQVRQCLIWAKSVMVMGRQDYQWKHEPCLYGWKSGAAHQWLSDRRQTTLLPFDKPARNAEHPTMKPVEMFRYLMLNSSKPGQIVLDPFAGSGTTLIAAEQTGRQACLMELDPQYADVIVHRWEQFTGRSAQRIPATDAVAA